MPNSLEAASRVGIESGYWDIWGKWREASADVRHAILTSLGFSCEDEAGLRESLLRLDRQLWSRPTPPVLVVSAGEQPPEIDLRVPAEWSDCPVGIRIDLEDGSECRALHQLRDAAEEERIVVDGVAYVRKRIRLSQSLPLGYHTLQVRMEGAGDAASTRLIVCPERAWQPPALEDGGRQAGLAISLYGVRSQHTWGCGDFTSLHGIIDWVASLGGSYVALNPLNAIHNRQPYNTSPYLPNSLLYRNFIYLDVDRVEEMRHSRWGRALRRHAGVLAEIAALNASEYVEYERVHALKLRLLRPLFRTFLATAWRTGGARAAEFRAYIESEGAELDRYALFSVLDAHLHRVDPNLWIWPDWPAEYRDPESAAVRDFRAEHERSILFHKYIQWQLDLQARGAQDYALSRGLDIGLFHDLPLATDRCGFELWANRSFYVDGCRVGSPPDGFAPQGQDWSFPPPRIERHRADGYRLFAETLRKSALHGGALRVDHVMRLFRLFWIPDGFEASQGAYVREPAEEMLGILALESVRGRFLVVGEDLGTVEPSMREMLARFGVLSYRLLYFEKGPGDSFRPCDEYPGAALVSSTTHDLPTLAGFWAGRDIEMRHSLGMLDEAARVQWLAGRNSEKHRLLDALIAGGLLPRDFDRSVANGGELTGELHNAIIGFLVSTPSQLMTLNQEDLTKELDQQNLPGTTHQYPNWRRKMRFSVEDLRESPVARDFAVMFRNWLIKTNRATTANRP